MKTRLGQKPVVHPLPKREREWLERAMLSGTDKMTSEEDADG